MLFPEITDCHDLDRNRLAGHVDVPVAAASAAKLGQSDSVIRAVLLLFIFLKIVSLGTLDYNVALTVFATKRIHLVRQGRGSLFSQARSSKGNYGLSEAPE